MSGGHTVGGGGSPSHHSAPGEGRQPRLPPSGPAATSSHPENPGVRETADGAEPAGCLPPWSSSIPVQGRASHPDPLYTSPERPRPTGPRLPAVRPPSGPSKAAFTSPHVSAVAAGTTTLSDVRVPPAAPSSAARPVPFTPLPPKPREGGGSGLRRGEDRPAGRGEGGGGLRRRRAGARAPVLLPHLPGAACALPRAEAPSLPKAAARTRVHSPA